MGAYEDLILRTVEGLLPPGRRMSTRALTRLVAPRVAAFFRDERFPLVDVLALTIVLRDSPSFIEVAPGIWMRREDRPEAGTRSRLRRPPLAGGAAAAAPLPVPDVSLDAVGGDGGKASVSRPATA